MVIHDIMIPEFCYHISAEKGEIPLKKRRIRTYFARAVSALLVVILTLGMMACSAPEKEEKKPEPEKVELWYYWDLPYQRKALASLIEEYNASQKEAQVVSRYIPDADFKKELALSIAEGTAPDLALVDSADFQFFQKAQPFVELTERIDGLEDYLPLSLNPCRSGEKIYGLPFGVNCLALIYNVEVFQQTGVNPPSTWKEFYEVVQKVSEKGVYGYAQSTLKSEESIYTFLPVLWSKGGDVDRLESRESTEAFAMFRKMSEEGIISPESVNLTFKDITQQFCNGKIGMMSGNAAQVKYIQKENPELNIGVVEIPTERAGDRRVSVSGGEIFGVLQGEKEEEAIAFLNYISDEKRMSDYIDDFGYMAARKDVLEGQYADNASSCKYLEVLAEARQRENSAEWPAISAVLVEALEASIRGEESQPEIQKRAEDKVKQIRGQDDEK